MQIIFTCGRICYCQDQSSGKFLALQRYWQPAATKSWLISLSEKWNMVRIFVTKNVVFYRQGCITTEVTNLL